jgi:dihydroorotase/N-acyl-D-amino-acid deacylase
MPRLLLVLVIACLASAQNDIVIRHARIADGTGANWYRGDIGVKGDTITAVARPGSLTGRRVIDAAGLTAAPGFLDTHSHSRRGIFETPGAENCIRMGVTTVIEGPDGGSPIPIKPFLDKLAATKFGVNFGLLAGQGSIRSEVMGSENRTATPAEIEKMKAITHQAMRDGAFGLSTGLFYVPGNYTPTGEVIELARIAGQYGGVHTSHMRDEAAAVLDSVRETIRIGEEGGLPTQLTHHKIIGGPNWGRSRETIRLVEEARARGVDVTIDQYPYTASSTGTAAMFPQWSLSGGHKALVERLNAPEQRQRIKAVIDERIRTDRGAGDPKNIQLASCPFDPTLDGKTLADVTLARGRALTIDNAAETAIEIQIKGGCSAIYHAMNEEDVERIMRYPHTMIASDGGIPKFGDGVPHPRNYGTFARVLGRYVRERGVLTLEEAIRRMTSLPAARFRIMDRGILRPGMKADIVLFDPATVADKAEFGRPHQYPAGFHTVLVNGVATLDAGAMTGRLAGRVLYGPGHRTP